MLLAEAVNLTVDGGSLVVGLTALGGSIGGGIVGAFRMLVNYLKAKDKRHDNVIDTLVKATNANTAALTIVAERVGGCPHRETQPGEEEHPGRKSLKVVEAN